MCHLEKRVLSPAIPLCTVNISTHMVVKLLRILFIPNKWPSKYFLIAQDVFYIFVSVRIIQRNGPCQNELLLFSLPSSPKEQLFSIFFFFLQIISSPMYDHLHKGIPIAAKASEP